MQVLPSAREHMNEARGKDHPGAERLDNCQPSLEVGRVLGANLAGQRGQKCAQRTDHEQDENRRNAKPHGRFRSRFFLHSMVHMIRHFFAAQSHSGVEVGETRDVRLPSIRVHPAVCARGLFRYPLSASTVAALQALL